MQALYKMVASFLSVALIFTSAAPSFAQTRSNSPFKVSGSNALENAVGRHVEKAVEQAGDTWWVNQGEKLVAGQCQIQGLPCILDVLFKAQQSAPKKDVLQAVVCDKDNLNCVPALAYAWGGVHYATKHLLYYQNKPIIETAPQFVELVSEYGLHSESDRQAAMQYFYDLIELAKKDCSNGSLEIGSSQSRADTRRANELQAGRCTAELAAMPALAVISKTQPEKKKAAETIYDVLKSKYDEASGGAVITAGATALGVLGTPRAYTLLEKFLTQDTIPSTAGNVWEGLWSPGKSTAQNSLRAASNIRGGNSRYLNRINEQFQYLDKAEAKRQGFTNTAWQSEGRQYPYANVLEEVGAFIGQQSASNASAQKLAKKFVAQANETAKSKTNAAGTLHYPLVLGILDGWRTHGKKFIYEPDPALLSLFYKGDWFDINEGTQRHVHYKAYQFAKARGWTWKTPEFDKEKKQRYIYNARIMGMGEAADIVAPLLLVEGLFRIVPVLAKGIPTAVRTLRGRTALVGTKNYLQNTKVAKPIAKEVPLKPAPAAQQVAPKSTKPAQLSVVKVDNKTAQILPEGYTVEQLNPGRTNITPKTFASTGDGVANTAKVQPQVAAPKAEPKTIGKPLTGNEPYIRGKVTNGLGQEIDAWVKNPNYVVPVSAKNPVHQLSWLDRARLNWAINFKPALQNAFAFGKSRYGAAALAPGVAPVTSEAAIMANTPVIAQTVRAQQSAFIAEEFLRGGAGASYRVGAVNPGGVAAAHYAQAALNAVSPATQAAKILAMSMGASRTVQTATPRRASGMAYSLVFPVPSFIMNRMLQARMPAEDGTDEMGGGSGQAADLHTQIDKDFILNHSVFEIFEAYYPDWKEGTAPFLNAENLPVTKTLEDIEYIIRYDRTSFTDEYGYFRIYLPFKDGLGRDTWEYSESITTIIALKETADASNIKISDSYRQRVYQRAHRALNYAKYVKATPASELLRIIFSEWEEKTLQEQKQERLKQERLEKKRLQEQEKERIAQENKRIAQEKKEAAAKKREEDRAQMEQKSIELIEQRAAEEALAAQKAQERAEEQAQEEEKENALKRQTSRSIEHIASQEEERFIKADQALLDEKTDANAIKAASAAEAQVAFLGQVTENFIERLLAFYHSITSEDYTARIRYKTSQQWIDKLQKFIDKYHRAPLRYENSEITSQQMLDETHLARAVYGLSDRLPKTNPDKQRIDQLLASVGMSKAEREQKRREQLLAAGKKGRATHLENLRQAREAQEATANEQNLQQAEQEIKNELQASLAAQANFQQHLDAELNAIEREWAEEDDIYNAIHQTSAAQIATQQRLSQELDAAERELLEQETRAQDEADLNAALAQTSAAHASSQARLDAELDAAEEELVKEEQEKLALKTGQTQATQQPTKKRRERMSKRRQRLAQQEEQRLASDPKYAQEKQELQDEIKQIEEKRAEKQAKQQQTQAEPEVTLSSLEKAISQFIELPMPFFLFEGILQNIFTSTDEKVAALADTHKRGRHPGYASLWLKTAEEEKYDVKNLGLIKLAKDKQSPLLPLFKLREKTQKSAPKQAAPAQEIAVEQTAPETPASTQETPAPTQENPVTPGSQLLTGIDGLKAYLPNWRAQLSATKAGFSKEQLDAIEAAFITTDEAMFAKDAEGNLIYNPNRSKEAWNYEEVFELALSEQGVSLTKRQFGQLFGGSGILGFTLKNYITLLNLTSFLAAHDRLPQKVHATVEGEHTLRTDVDKVKSRGKVHGISTTDPIMQALGTLTNSHRVYREKSTPTQILEQLKQYMAQHNGEYPAYHAPAGSIEAYLNNAVTDAINAAKKKGTDKTDPVIIELNQIKEDNRQFDVHKTALKWYAALQQWLAKHNNKLPSKNSSLEEERQLRNGIDNTLATAKRSGVFDTDEAVIALNQLYTQHKGKDTTWSTQQIYDELTQYLAVHKQMPPDGSRLYYTLTSRLYYHKKNNKGYLDTDGNFVYDDPYLQKIYELKLAVQAAPTGKFTITPDGKGSYVLEIAPEALQEIAVEEAATTKVTAPKPTHHSIRLRIDKQIKQAMENAQEQDALERRNFSKWVWTMNSLDYRNLLINRETSNALYNIARNVKADAQKHIARLKVTYLVNTLNNIRAVLKNSTAQTYYRLIYHGTVAENKLPIANNFHIVAEEKGIDRQEQVAKQAESFLAKNPELSVFIDERNKTHISRIGLKKNASIDQAAKDLQALITQLTPTGYVYRMGEHELGLSGNLDNFRHGNVHLHLESIANDPTEDGLFVDISLTLDIGAWRFAGWYNKNKEFEPYFDKKIAENYQKLFAPYLNEEGKQALNKLTNPTSGPTSAGEGSTPIGPRYRR